MIFLDTNIVLRLLTAPTDTNTRRYQQESVALFEQVAHGEVAVTTSELVIHQCMYFLTGPRFYALPLEVAVGKMEALLALEGVHLETETRAVIAMAFDLLLNRPSLGFADCLILSRCNLAGHELATFDQKLARVPDVLHWQPTAG